MTRLVLPLALSAAIVFAFAVPAEAQGRRWGVAASFVPTWTTVDSSKVFYDADAVDLSGAEFSIGLVRGRSRGGEVGVSFVSKSVKEGGTIDRGDVVTTMGDDVRVIGVLVHGAPVIARFADERVQIGLLVGGGLGTVRGQARRSDADVEADEALPLFGNDVKIHPLAQLQAIVSVAVARGLRVRAGGGFDYPGLAKFTLGAIYLFE